MQLRLLFSSGRRSLQLQALQRIERGISATEPAGLTGRRLGKVRGLETGVDGVHLCLPNLGEDSDAFPTVRLQVQPLS